MQTFVADAVFEFINQSLAVRERLESADSLVAKGERAELMQLLAPFEVEDEVEFDLVFSESDGLPKCNAMTRAAIRHALVAWLDEWLSKSRDPQAGAKFWDEARYAETRNDLEALEIMHLCVMLGFRGAMADQPERLEAWTNRIGTKLKQGVQTLAMPASQDMPPARRRREKRTRKALAFSLLLTVALLLPAAAVWIFKY